MANLSTTRLVDRATLDQILAPRQDIVQESAGELIGDEYRFGLATGPFSRYQRTVTVGQATNDPATSGATGVRSSDDPATDFAVSVTEEVDYKLAIPLWWPYLWLLFRRALTSLDRRPRRRWWWPQETVSADTSRLIAVVGTIGTMAAYFGTLIGQTITFAARDFGAADDAQANTLAAVRVGVLLSFVFLRFADRVGRRPLMIWFATAAIFFTALGALAPSLFWFGASQAVARGLATGLLTLVGLAAAEEVPASSRALAISFTTLASGFGAGLVVWTLPLADLVPGGWRISYLIPLGFLPLLWWLSRSLPETRRYVAADRHESADDVNWGRFALLAATSFIFLMFASPASQLRNEFLTDDRGFSAADVTVFQIVVSIPATMVIPLGGYLADTVGRRRTGGWAILIGSLSYAASYALSGPAMWLTALIGICGISASAPAMRGYSTELFPTRARGRVGGMLDAIGVAGSALGLIIVGMLSVRWDNLGGGIGVMIFAPLIAVSLIFLRFPETANKHLEQFNPDDPAIEGPRHQ